MYIAVANLKEASACTHSYILHITFFERNKFAGVRVISGIIRYKSYVSRSNIRYEIEGLLVVPHQCQIRNKR